MLTADFNVLVVESSIAVAVVSLLTVTEKVDRKAGTALSSLCSPSIFVLPQKRSLVFSLSTTVDNIFLAWNTELDSIFLFLLPFLIVPDNKLGYLEQKT